MDIIKPPCMKNAWLFLYNPNFKVVESEHFKQQARLLAFTPSVSEWVEQTDAIKNYIIPVCNYRDDLKWLTYAEKTDLLNVAFLETHNAQLSELLGLKKSNVLSACASYVI